MSKKLITDQLRGLQKVLEEVSELVEDEEAKTTSRLPAMVQVLQDSNGLSRCRVELETLKSKLEPKRGLSDRVKGLVWPLQESDVEKTLEHLRRFQDLLVSAMNVDQTCVFLA